MAVLREAFCLVRDFGDEERSFQAFLSLLEQGVLSARRPKTTETPGQ